MFRRDRRLHQLSVIFTYLKSFGQIENILKQCRAASTVKDGIFTVTIPLNMMMLSEMDSALANLVMCRPLDGALLFREVVHQMLVVHGFLADDDDDVRHLVVSLRVTSATVPDLRSMKPQRRHYEGLVRLTGVVLGVTATVSYTKSTKYICPNENCEGHHSNQYLRIHIPGASEKETVGQHFKCSACFAALKEVRSQRTLSEKLLAEVIPCDVCKEYSFHTQFGSYSQAVPAIIRDDLCQQVQLGQQYEMIGTMRIDSESEHMACMFEVNNMTPANHSFMYALDSDRAFSMLPRWIQQVYAEWGKVSLVFPHLMAFSLADRVAPPPCFFRLKLLLLISLVLPEEVPPLHVLIVCSETHIIQRLLEFCAHLGYHSVRHSSLSTLGAKASSSRYPWAPYFIQGLSEGRVLVTLEAKHTGGLPGVLTLPLSCQVWACTSPDAADLPPALLDAFSIVCHCSIRDAASSVDVTEDLVSSILASSMSTGEEGYTPQLETVLTGDFYHRSADGKVSVESFKQFVAIAREQKSVMTVEAEWLLTSYLKAARHARSHIFSSTTPGSAVPISAMHALQSLAHGLCRLSLRREVLETDAVMAIYLYEEFLSARHGMSGLNVFPEPHLTATSSKEYITMHMPAALRKFHSRLLSFCTGSSVVKTSEE